MRKSTKTNQLINTFSIGNNKDKFIQIYSIQTSTIRKTVQYRVKMKLSRYIHDNVYKSEHASTLHLKCMYDACGQARSRLLAMDLAPRVAHEVHHTDRCISIQLCWGRSLRWHRNCHPYQLPQFLSSRSFCTRS